MDNIAENFQLQANNGIFISTWHDDPQDTELKQLIPLLKQIVLLNVEDVRKSLKEYRDQMLRMIGEGNSEALKDSQGEQIFTKEREWSNMFMK